MPFGQTFKNFVLSLVSLFTAFSLLLAKLSRTLSVLYVCVDRYVILGGHRDAWVFGGIDPMSGAAVVHEAVRSAGRLVSKGE